MDLPALGAAYGELRPALTETAAALEGHLDGIIRSQGIRGANVSSRVKETASFIKKVWERSVSGDGWDDPLSQCTDKVGCRADVVYHRDVQILREAIEADDDLEVVKIDDKAMKLGPAGLGYGGLHIDVVPRSCVELVGYERAQCEIQVRTHAQAAWAMASHELSYKGPGEVSELQQRRLNRLTALVELFDDVVDQVSGEIMTSENYPISKLIDRLEGLWLTCSGQPYSAELTSSLLATLLSDLTHDEASQLSEEVAEFVEERRAKIARSLSEAVDHPLLTQPEALFLYYCLENDKYGFVDNWRSKGLDWDLLDSAATKLGIRIPQPT